MARDDDSDQDAPPTGTAIGSRAPARPVWPQRRKVGDKLHMWERLDYVQKLLASGMAPSTVSLTLMREHGLTRHEADDYQAVVRARWRKNGALEDSEQEMLRLKAIAYQAIQDAASRRITVRTGSDDDGPIYEVVEQPDSKAVLAGVALLARMIGKLDAPEKPAAALPANGEPATGEVTVIDRADLNETLRARRASGT